MRPSHGHRGPIRRRGIRHRAAQLPARIWQAVAERIPPDHREAEAIQVQPHVHVHATVSIGGAFAPQRGSALPRPCGSSGPTCNVLRQVRRTQPGQPGTAGDQLGHGRRKEHAVRSPSGRRMGDGAGHGRRHCPGQAWSAWLSSRRWNTRKRHMNDVVTPSPVPEASATSSSDASQRACASTRAHRDCRDQRQGWGGKDLRVGQCGRRLTSVACVCWSWMPTWSGEPGRGAEPLSQDHVA